jgi:hypothetical protein
LYGRQRRASRQDPGSCRNVARRRDRIADRAVIAGHVAGAGPGGVALRLRDRGDEADADRRYPSRFAVCRQGSPWLGW